MANPVIDLGTVERLRDAARFYEGRLAEVVRIHPETRSFAPMEIGGWSTLLAGLAMTSGALFDQPGARGVATILEIMEHLTEDLKRSSITVAEARSNLEKLETGLILLREAGVDPGTADLASIVPSPSTVQRAVGPALADAVARVTVWQRAHHGRIHVPLSVAESGEAAALHPFAAAVAGLGATVADAFRAVVGHMLPELRAQLVDLIRSEREARRAGDQNLAERLNARADRLADRIGDVVRWLRTEALPDVAERINLERDARRDADRDLEGEIVRATGPLSTGLADLSTAVAPLLGPATAAITHATQKVRNNEGLIDQLGRMDLGLLLSLAAFPNLVELVTRILADVGGKIPGIVGALEDAASEALGAVR